jgi:hypothetical protein
LAGRDRTAADGEDAGLLRRDLADGGPEDVLVVQADRGDHRELVRPGDRVGGVEQSPEPGFYDPVVDPVGEQAERDGVGDLEEGRPTVAGLLHRLDCWPDPFQLRVDEVGSGGSAVDLEPLEDGVGVRRQVGADPEPVGPEQARHEGAHRPLPRGARDVHGAEAVLRIPQRPEQGPRAGEPHPRRAPLRPELRE